MNTLNNQEKVDRKSKDAGIKTLAILGSLAVVIIGVWLAVQFVRILPDAFSSLASIANDVYKGERSTETTFEVSSNASAINSSESFTLSWNDLEEDGTYHFRYECVDGLSAAVRIEGIGVEYLDCNEIYSFDGTVDSFDVYVESEKYRSADFVYILTFVKTDTEDTLVEHQGKVTIVNEMIGNTETEPETEPETEEDTDSTDTDEEETVTSTPKPKTPAKPVYKTVYVPYIPVSLDNGVVDLAVTVVGTGYVKGKTFYPSITVDNDSDATIQIEVRNIGTKTSDEWDIDIELPNGDDYSRDNRKGLKPNEREILTIIFDAEDETGIERFDGKVSVDDDVATSNNRFSGTMRFVN